MSSRPIIIVTGANSGVGLGICHRLLSQLSQRDPPDAHPAFNPTSEVAEVEEDGHIYPCSGLTLVMACRSINKAEAARRELYDTLDKEIAERSRKGEDDGFGGKFRRNLTIDILQVDLSQMSSVFKFCDEVRQKYPYVSHLIFNAGVIHMSGIAWFEATIELCTHFIHAVTYPSFYKQHTGEMSRDGLGWVWQSNVFGHFAMYRSLQPLLSQTPAPCSPSRVIWTSSLEAHRLYDSDDFQLTKTDHSYEGSKYQIELIATQLARREDREKNIRHFIVHPGVASTNISASKLNFFTEFFKVLTFFIARFFGSPHHTITAANAAFSAVHVTLVSISLIPLSLWASKSSSHSNGTASHSNGNGLSPSSNSPPVKFASVTDRWGNPGVLTQEIAGWNEDTEKESALLVGKCERLYQGFLEAEGRKS
ncbi:hypothetical protein JAAARDRAFT_202254 [Jaapia argillacea MUCL 33604]|uniref:3-keto sterol reductase n=1 Tax=Jaapia argillacea MUCL 33604 TaxID=933084 RepID=A0A067QDJ9_9AGAM|nr:hypothetical protein JAAARDRAFT_202254 [Jaapia argillacea MUCL 33604]